MSRGKYLSLEEARKREELIRQFCKEHKSKGDENEFDRIVNAMSKPKPVKMKLRAGRTSKNEIFLPGPLARPSSNLFWVK